MVAYLLITSRGELTPVYMMIELQLACFIYNIKLCNKLKPVHVLVDEILFLLTPDAGQISAVALTRRSGVGPGFV